MTRRQGKKQSALENELDGLLAESIESAKRREAEALERSVGFSPDSFVIFGAGSLGRRTAVGLGSLGLRVLAYSDNNSSLWNSRIEDIPVLSPESAVRQYGRSAAFIVAIWNDTQGHPFGQVEKQLQELGPCRVASFAHLYWRYPETFLPYYGIDLPHRVLEQATDVREAMTLWADEKSRHEYVAQVGWRLFLDDSALFPPDPGPQYFPDSLFLIRPGEVFIDGGAFDGDTLRELLLHHANAVEKIVAFEPDPVNFEKLRRFVKSLDKGMRPRIQLSPAALGASTGEVGFRATGTIRSEVTPDDPGNDLIPSVALDEALAGEEPTYIKLDIEGSEYEALLGAENLIRSCLPVVAVSAYHRFDHLWKLPQLIASLSESYRFFLRPYARPIWELVCYAIPADRVKRGRE